jgi:hypothetical protein
MCPSLSTQADFFYNKKLVFAVAAIVIVIITADMIICSFYDVLTSSLLPNDIQFQTSNFVSATTTTIILFIVITAITYGVGWPFFSALIDKAGKSLRKSPMPYFEQIGKALTLIKYVIFAILGLLIIEMLFFSYYHTILLITATVVSYIPASVILSMLCYNLLSWYKSNRRYVVLLYALSTAMVAIAIGLNAAIYSGLLLQKPGIISFSELQDVHFTEISAATAGWAGSLYFIG